MSAPLSRKLVVVEDVGQARPGTFVVEGNPDQGYDLYAAELTHLGHHRRSWQAVQAAHDQSLLHEPGALEMES